MRGVRDETGQAGVELAALLPLIALIGALVMQAAIAGQAIWLAQAAARSAARAQAIGLNGEGAARRSLPDRLEDDLTLQTDADGGVRLTVSVPSLWGGALTTIAASARMESQR